MEYIDAWQRGHNEGLTLAVRLINEWCELDCKTISDVIKAINEMKEAEHEQ